ncbi:MAG: sel1 repeat family protein, partial [Kiritimatiellae bacterium]|nr:sel1 repeat family protein [Kiritimatiellia bacterium]
AESGNGRAQYALGYLHEGGYHGEKKKASWDISLAWDWYRKSAENGCIQGQKAFARILRGGRCWKQLIGMDLRELVCAPDKVKDALDWDEIRDKCFRLQAEDLRESLKWCRIIAERGDIQMCYDLACRLVVGDAGVQDIEEGVKWLETAAQAGFPKAISVVAAAEGDESSIRLAAELHISLLVEKSKKQEQGGGGPLEFCLDVSKEDVNAEFGEDWLRANSPDGVVVPPPSGRNTMRTPNLKSANPSFAALLIGYIRDKFAGDAPTVYRAAHVSRKTYSAIISNELRAVSKNTAIAFALALKLSPNDADALLRSAGHALSEFLLEDMIVRACIGTGIYEIEKVNEILVAHGSKPLPRCRA